MCRNKVISTKFYLVFVITIVACSTSGSTVVDADMGSPISIKLTIPEVGYDNISCNISMQSNAHILKEKGVVYGIHQNPTIDGLQQIANTENLDFQITIHKLKGGVLYYLRAYALDAEDSIYYSEELSVRVRSDTSNENEEDFRGLDYQPTDSINEYAGYELVWSDEFNTDSRPSPDNWGYEEGFVRNQEAQYYSDSEENNEVRDGTLIITARRNHNGHSYTSSSLHTRNKHHFTYGRFEIRAKLAVCEGCWPAIWTVGNQYDWPIGGEIDIMEFYDRSILANVAWSGSAAYSPVWDSHKMPVSNWLFDDPYFLDKYHLWRMDWDHDFIKLYIDDQLLNTIDLNETINRGWQGNYDNPFRYQNENFGQYLILNLAIGGTNGGTIDTKAFPQEFKIDYVRVYQPSQ
ncbi:MAG: glycoside hydrolase family 16 protein [Cyclobacteriaceae bacterium]